MAQSSLPLPLPPQTQQGLAGDQVALCSSRSAEESDFGAPSWNSGQLLTVWFLRGLESAKRKKGQVHQGGPGSLGPCPPHTWTKASLVPPWELMPHWGLCLESRGQVSGSVPTPRPGHRGSLPSAHFSWAVREQGTHLSSALRPLDPSPVHLPLPSPPAPSSHPPPQSTCLPTPTPPHTHSSGEACTRWSQGGSR